MSIHASTPGATDVVPRSLRILYADDVPELRCLLEVTLGRVGHTVETVPDGQEALTRILATPATYDLVITDHHMPKMNGLELVGRLRALPFPGKIVVFSSELDEDISQAYRQLRVDCILPKPIFPDTLRSVLAAL